MLLGLLLLLLLWHRAHRLSSISWGHGAHRGTVRSISVRFVVGTLMQSDLVIASDCDFDLVAGVAEEVLRIVVGQIAGIVLVNFGNDIATQQFLLGRAVHLDPGDDQWCVEVRSADQPDPPCNLGRATLQRNQEIVRLRTHDFGSLNVRLFPEYRKKVNDSKRTNSSNFPPPLICTFSL